MSETTELRIDDRPKLEDGQDDHGHDPQYDARVAIAERYERQRMEEMREQHENLGLPAPEIDAAPEDVPAPVQEEAPQVSQDEPVEAAPEREPLAVPTQAPQIYQPPPPPQLIPMALPDGRLTHVTPEQYQQLASLGIQALARPQAPTPQPPAARAAPPQPVLDDTRAASIAQRLSFGTVDEQKQAIMEFGEALRPAPQHVDVEALQRNATHAAIQHITLQQNLNQLGSEYPDIFNDPVLTQVAALQLNQLRGNPQFQMTRSDLDQYREACNLVRQRFQPAPAPQPQPPVQSYSTAPQAAPTVAGRQAVLERKRAAPSIPAVADRRMTADGDTAPREETPSEVIARIRKARHQAAV